MNDLAYYRLLPYEREWMMKEDGVGGDKYFVVRLKDIPAIAGDGFTRDEAADDLRCAFDEYVTAWLAAGRDIPKPGRGFTVPEETTRRPAKEWLLTTPQTTGSKDKSSNWADNAVIFSNSVVEEPRPGPSLTQKFEPLAAEG